MLLLGKQFVWRAKDVEGAGPKANSELLDYYLTTIYFVFGVFNLFAIICSYLFKEISQNVELLSS